MDQYIHIRYPDLLKQLHFSKFLTISHETVKQMPVTIPTTSSVLRFGQDEILGIYLGKILRNYKNICLSSMTSSNMVMITKIS